jgi:hypothetical protein
MPHITRREMNQAIAAASLGLLATDIASPAAPPDDPRAGLDALLAETSKTEKRITNMTIESEAVEEHLIGDQWIAQPITVALLARFDGTPGGKARFDVSKQVVEWRDGAAPYWESSYSVAYNGKSFTRMNISSGRLGQTEPEQAAFIVAGRSSLMAGHLHLASGARFHISHWHPHIGDGLDVGCRSLTGYIKDYLAPCQPGDVTVQINREKRDGVAAIRLNLHTRFNFQISWWLDPNRGHNLLAYRQTQFDKQGALREVHEENVVELAKVVDRGDETLWYPTEAYYYFPTDPGETRRRFHYKAKRVVLNDPAFDDAVFEIAIPPGYFVDDRVHKQQFHLPQQ